MKKVLSMKKWFTIKGCANYLSSICNEKIKEIDILQLALEKEIVMSVIFLQEVPAKKCRLIEFNSIEVEAAFKNKTYPEGLVIFDLNDNEYLEMFNLKKSKKPKYKIANTEISDNLYLYVEEKIRYISGIWDLPMMEGEEIKIREAIQNKLNQNELDVINIFGTYVCNKDGVFMELQDFSGEIYFSSGNLPKDCNLVVTKESLQAFEENLLNNNENNKNNENDEKPFSIKEQYSLLTIIAALCMHSNTPFDKRDSSKNIQLIIEENGFNMDIDTVRKWIKKFQKQLPQKQKIGSYTIFWNNCQCA